ncbi:hypothetical protein [Cryptosporangium aurantiacum]|uniref:Protein kinase domain-containing protein n=1 Tax=Cryptosporangium aurantiacum TaxID=134849 RepID=A0A1M7R880_9ACTN|nr:hypothetical protein [Cryptosporangium aurantiacum]SHN42371.1 hypothetical protein SAMN05443668_108188 [Cryptosporangium aurantiacum]
MDGTSLAELLARVDRVRCGEAVALFAPLADALAAAHAAGGTHGAVGADTVVVAPDGIPYLDAGLAPGAPPPDDVRDLAALLVIALVGPCGVDDWAERAFALGVPAGLVTMLAGALATEPERRPTAAEVATALRKTCDPLPLDRLLVIEDLSAGHTEAPTPPSDQ